MKHVLNNLKYGALFKKLVIGHTALYQDFRTLNFIFIWPFISIFQLTLSIVMYVPEVRENGFTMPPFSFALPFVVPSIVYFINNNLSVQAQVHMDPATYQVRKRLFAQMF